MTHKNIAFFTTEQLPSLAPPSNTVGATAWIRQNLFSSPINSIFTLLGLYVVYLTIPPLLNWAFFSSDWSGTSRADCTTGGACWVFVQVRLQQFIYGFYPSTDIWRVNLGFLMLVALMAPLFIEKTPRKGLLAAFLLFVYPVIAFILFSGGSFGLSVVTTDQWGGLMLTLVIASVGIVASLPLGVLLALGRRSDMPIVKSSCVVFIEIWRGVPLITVLFMSSVMLPLFLPEGVTFDKLLRALIGITLFQSAYMAEVIRGGLQAIPKGQYEAAQALGLGYWKTMGLIILPQALKMVIPGIVNTFIALFKDTTLVIIIGLFDLLGAVENAIKDPAWLGMAIEGYVFAAAVFWVFCFGMSRYSISLENKLHTGHKR
jgi:general L-amino acid transport system permease protein